MDNSMPQKMDILLAGVGGQGVVLAGDIIGDLGLAAGYDVKKSDTLGMAQRGGSVVAHIRLGQVVEAPLIPQGEADYLLGFEKLEAVRWVDYLRNGSIVFYNDQAVPPLSVNREEASYPTNDEIMQAFCQRTSDIFVIPAERISRELGNTKTTNMVMLGAMSMFMPFPSSDWKKMIAQRVPEDVVEINVRAFETGRKEVLRQMEQTAQEMERQSLEQDHDEGCGCGH